MPDPETQEPKALTREEMLAMMVPRVVAREMMRDMLIDEGEDGHFADQCYEGDGD